MITNRRVYIFSIFLLAVLTCNAQTAANGNLGLYSWKEVVMIQPSDYNGVAIPGAVPIPSRAGQLFRVINTSNNTSLAVIQVIDYTKAISGAYKAIKPNRILEPKANFYVYNFNGTSANYNSLPDEEANARAYGKYQRYFTVSLATVQDERLARKESKVMGSLAAGVMNFPFKYRPQKHKGDFSGAFNFGAGLGFALPHKSWRTVSYSFISGYSISNIVLDQSNTIRNQAQLSENNNFTAFSFSIGALAEYQRVQAGLFIGWDRLSKLNNNEYGWVFQGRPWISVGFGFAIFSPQQEAEPKSTGAEQ